MRWPWQRDEGNRHEWMEWRLVTGGKATMCERCGGIWVVFYANRPDLLWPPNGCLGLLVPAAAPRASTDSLPLVAGEE